MVAVPHVVRTELGRGAEVYALLLTFIGIGAVSGAMELPRIRARFTRDALVAGASVLHALAALVLGYSQNLALLIVATLATGVAWISILSAVQVSAQTTLPPWGRARGLAAFIVTFMGGMAFGSILWGQVASCIGHPVRAHRGRGWHGDRDCADVAIRARSTRRAGLSTPTMDLPVPVLAEKRRLHCW